jgi:hypothetical protein
MALPMPHLHLLLCTPKFPVGLDAFSMSAFQ